MRFVTIVVYLCGNVAGIQLSEPASLHHFNDLSFLFYALASSSLDHNWTSEESFKPAQRDWNSFKEHQVSARQL